MGKIILIGGGEIANNETVVIDRKFIELSGGEKSVIGFFATAAHDSDGYIQTFSNYFQNLGCRKIIPVKLSQTTRKECENLIKQMTGIYLGGGDTKLLIKEFKDKGVDMMIKEALNNDLVVAGMSAGALASCDYYIDPDTDEENHQMEKGLGFQDSVLCVVHYEVKDDSMLSLLREKYPDYEVLGIKEKQGVLVDGNSFRWLS